MARSSKNAEAEVRSSGLSLAARFILFVTLSLAAVMGIAGYLLYQSSTSIAQQLQEDALVEATRLAARKMKKGQGGFFQQGSTATPFRNGLVQRFPISYEDGGKTVYGYLYQASLNDDVANVIVPRQIGEDLEKGLLGLIVGISSAVVLAGALVSYLVANAAAKPLGIIIEDIRQIAHGNLRHKTRVRAGGEIAILARTVDRMTASLSEAQEAQLELSVRDREAEVAGEVREALMPEAIPQAAGYDIGSAHIASPNPGGDFHDFIEYSDGRIGLLACDVSGMGVPGALVGATARAYLRTLLTDCADVEAAFKQVNRELARDVRRGMYVTALYALLDPGRGVATVVCAGHKIPLLRYSAADGKMRLVHPEGIALAFDPGPVFDRSLAVQEVPLEPGDRLLLSNTGPVKVMNPDGEEYGEKEFFKTVLRYSGSDTETMLDRIADELEEFAEDEPLPNDLSFVSVAREVG